MPLSDTNWFDGHQWKQLLRACTCVKGAWQRGGSCFFFEQRHHKCCYFHLPLCWVQTLNSQPPTLFLFSFFFSCTETIVMFDFGDELTIQSYGIPWLIWIQLLILLLIIVFLYCCSIFAFESSDEYASASPSVVPFASSRSDVDKSRRNSTAGTVTGSIHSKVCLFFSPLFFFGSFWLARKEILSFNYVIFFLFVRDVWLLRKFMRK